MIYIKILALRKGGIQVTYISYSTLDYVQLKSNDPRLNLDEIILISPLRSTKNCSVVYYKASFSVLK